MLRPFTLRILELRINTRPFHSTSLKQKISISEMNRSMSVSFLGTSSGGGPTATRNCSSLVADVLADGSLWMVDCAEGTLRQFALQPWTQYNHLKASNVKKLFLTHMHVDHVMGVVPLLRNLLFAPAIDPSHAEDPHKPPKIEIYGPAGIRTFIRSILNMTFTKTAEKYVCHELLKDDDPLTPCDPPELMHSSEIAGRDIRANNGLWRSLTSGQGTLGPVFMDAGPISHRDPCIGYVIRESVSPFRKIVVLGDTYDASSIVPLCTDPSPSLLIHESTDAHISQSIDPKAKRSLEVVRDKTFARGHSMPEMAGAFAKRIGAKKLVLNHIGGRFPSSSPRDRDSVRANVIREIERQASAAWEMGSARVAWDYMSVGLPASDSYIQYQDPDLQITSEYNTAPNRHFQNSQQRRNYHQQSSHDHNNQRRWQNEHDPDHARKRRR